MRKVGGVWKGPVHPKIFPSLSLQLFRLCLAYNWETSCLGLTVSGLKTSRLEEEEKAVDEDEEEGWGRLGNRIGGLVLGSHSFFLPIP